MTTNNFSNLSYELINDKYSKAKYLGIECIMETKTGFINATKFCIKAQNPEDTEAQKDEDEKKAQEPHGKKSYETRGKRAQETRGKKAGDGKKSQETQVKKAGDGIKSQETQVKKAGDGIKMFKHYIENARYNNLIKYMKSSGGYLAELSIRVTSGDYELWGTYVHPDLLLDLASWISPAAYIKASGIVRNFFVREKEEENMRLVGANIDLKRMFSEESKRREEADKRAEQDRLERKEAEKRAEQLLLQMTHQNEKTHIDHKKTLEKITHQNEKTHVELDETKKTLEQITHQNEKTHIELDKTKITLRRVEARVDILVEEVVPPAKKVSLHEQFGIMKLNDSEGKREYKVYCSQTRGVCKARASILKEYPKAVLIKEVKPNANAKNFLHKLKEKYGTGKKAMINVSYNFIKLKDGVTEKELIEAIDEVVGEALRYGE